MKIQTKILNISIIVFLSLFISVSVYAFFSNQVNKIEKEQNILNEIQNILEMERLLVTDIQHRTYSESRNEYQNFIDNSETISDKVDSMILLPKTSIKISDSLDNIKNLGTIIKINRNSLINNYDDYLNVISLYFDLDQTNYSNIFFKGDELIEDKALFTFKWQNIFVQIKQMLKVIDTSLEILEEQTIQIEYEISKIQQKILIISIMIILPLLLFSFFMSYKISSTIKKSISVMKENLNFFMDGDLTKTINSMSKDELGELSDELDHFRSYLKESMYQIKLVSNNNLLSKESLKKSVILSNTSLEKVNESASEIDRSSAKLNTSMEFVVKAVDSTFDLIQKLGSQINSQNNIIEDSSSAIIEIISSVDSIAVMSEQGQTGVDLLVTRSVEGRDKMNETQNVIEEINNSIEGLLEMLEIIKNISSQTNLLSMNAAIEAAHAGDAGRGFSVVAEEIGKLSDSTSDSTNQMSEEINNIVALIEKASGTSVSTSSSFDEINKEVKMVDRIFTEVHTAVKELRESGSHIQDITINLKDFSSEVVKTSTDISGNTETVNQEIKNVGQISLDIKQESSQIVENMNLITERMKKVEDASRQIESGSESMDTVLKKFKTDIE